MTTPAYYPPQRPSAQPGGGRVLREIIVGPPGPAWRHQGPWEPGVAYPAYTLVEWSGDTWGTNVALDPVGAFDTSAWVRWTQASSSGAAASRTRYPFDTSSTEHLVQHNKGGQPPVTVVDSAGTAIPGIGVTYVDPDSVLITHKFPFSGAVYI